MPIEGGYDEALTRPMMNTVSDILVSDIVGSIAPYFYRSCSLNPGTPRCVAIRSTKSGIIFRQR